MNNCLSSNNSVAHDTLRDFQIKKYPVVLKAGGQGAGSRGRKGHFSCRNLDHLFCGVL